MNDLTEILKQYTAKSFPLTPIRQLPAGKEALVWVVRSSNQERTYALKVYRDATQRAFQKQADYQLGKHWRRPSERKAVARKTTFGRQLVQDTWVDREWFVLRKLSLAGVLVPKPVFKVDHSILLQFIGDHDQPAPRLQDCDVSPFAQRQVWLLIIAQVKAMWHLGVIHGDLSPYNILYWRQAPYIIDFPQAIDTRRHPDAQTLLHRDLANAASYFPGQLVGDLEATYSQITA